MDFADFEYHIKRAIDARAPLFELADTDCFRLLNAEADGLPGISIDLYKEFVLVQYFREYGDEQLDRALRVISRVLEHVPVSIRGLLVKNRVKVGENRDYENLRRSIPVDGELPPEDYAVLENGVKACVDLVHGQSTGVFMDMREIRDMLHPFYNNSIEMLNLFSYTSLFSIHGIINGIKSAVNVDLSKSVLKKAMKNYELNGLPSDNRDFIYGDARSWVNWLMKKGRTFSFIVFDPPTFARKKKRSFSVKKDYANSLLKVDRIADAYIFTSVNSYSVTKDEYISYHPSWWEPVFFASESSDFLDKRNPYLKAGLWKKKYVP